MKNQNEIPNEPSEPLEPPEVEDDAPIEIPEHLKHATRAAIHFYSTREIYDDFLADPRSIAREGEW